MNSRGLFLAAFIVTGSLIAYEDIAKCHMLPWPPRFIFTGITFGLLDLAAGFIGDLAGLIAIGMTLAAILDTIAPPKQVQKGHVLLTFGPSCQIINGVPQAMPGASSQPGDAQFLQGNTGAFVETAPGTTPGTQSPTGQPGQTPPPSGTTTPPSKTGSPSSKLSSSAAAQASSAAGFAGSTLSQAVQNAIAAATGAGRSPAQGGRGRGRTVPLPQRPLPGALPPLQEGGEGGAGVV